MPSVFGRAAEQATLVELVASSSSGAVAIVLEGAPGIGKTTLWYEALDAARADGHLVLAARPASTEASFAYGTLADLLEPLVAEGLLLELPGPQRDALAVALMREAPAGRLEQRAVAAGVLAGLRARALGGAVTIAVDDVQWLDSPSARVLSFALRRLESLPVAFVVCRRVAPGVKSPIRFEELLPPERVHRLQLGPLSAAALQRLVSERLGRSLPRRSLLRVAQSAGGNPFYALEIARSLPDPNARTPLVVPIPESLQELVDQRLAHLPKRARATLLYAAAALSPTTELLAACVGDEPAVSQAVTRATEAEIVTLEGSHVRFCHPLYAEALVASATEPELRGAHRVLAWLARDPERRAWHRALAAEEPDERIAKLLDGAAERARARGAPQAAAELAEQACSLTPPSRLAALRRRTTTLAEYSLHAGDLAGAAQLLEDVLASAEPGDERARARLLLAEARYQQDSFPAALELLEQARVEATDPGLLALVLAQLCYLHVSFGDLRAARVAAQEAAARLGDRPSALACALATGAMTDFLLGEGADWPRVERALELEDHDAVVPAVVRPSVVAGLMRMYVGDLDAAQVLLEVVRDRLLERGQESDLAFVAYQLTWLRCWRGELEEACRSGREALEAATSVAGDALLAPASAFAALAHAMRGEESEGRKLAEAASVLSERSGHLLPTFFARDAVAVLELARGRPREALAALLPLLPIAEAGNADPVLFWFTTDLVEALAGCGDLDRADALAASYEVAARRLDRAWAIAAVLRSRALVEAARGCPDVALASLDEALGQHERTATPLERARTLLVRGVVERRLKRKREASASLRAAIELFDAAGALGWARRGREELQRVGLRPTAPDELSQTERRVAELAAAGLSNAEIAAAAFMSRKTVEANLTRVYRKLAIRSRAELGLRLLA